jgi:hypothetical protein
LSDNAHEKHQIKTVDRLLGNAHLHSERLQIYRAIARTLWSGSASADTSIFPRVGVSTSGYYDWAVLAL